MITYTKNAANELKQARKRQKRYELHHGDKTAIKFYYQHYPTLQGKFRDKIKQQMKMKREIHISKIKRRLNTSLKETKLRQTIAAAQAAIED